MKRLFVLLTLVAAGAASAEPAPPAESATNAPAAAVAATNLPPAELAAATNAPPRKPLRPAVITAESTFYDRKEGIAVFTGKVHVDDERYQIHADKAYVSIVPTNQLRRIVAIGHVAMTNEARRAYGANSPDATGDRADSPSSRVKHICYGKIWTSALQKRGPMASQTLQTSSHE